MPAVVTDAYTMHSMVSECFFASACVFVIYEPRKRADSIEVLFRELTHVGPMNRVLHEVYRHHLANMIE